MIVPVAGRLCRPPRTMRSPVGGDRGGAERCVASARVPAAIRTYKGVKSGRRGTAPIAAETSVGAGPGLENGPDKLLRHVAGKGRVLGGGKRGLLELNGLAIAVEVGDAPGALGQVLLELGPFRGGQVVEQVFVQKLGELAAVHTSPLRKWGSSSVRR